MYYILLYTVAEGSLDVKLATIRKDGKALGSQKKEEERRSEKRTSQEKVEK